MVGIDLETVWKQLAGFYPQYMEDGCNGTVVVLEGGNELQDRRKTKTFLRRLAKSFAIDIQALREKYRRPAGRRTFVPLPFHAGLVLVPFKVRRVLSKDQGATGYAVLDKIECWAPGEEAPSKLILSGGGSFPCMERHTTVERKILEGRAVAEEFRQFHLGDLPGIPGVTRQIPMARNTRVMYHVHYSAGDYPGGGRMDSILKRGFTSQE